MPTPEREKTPPSAIPLTMNGFRSGIVLSSSRASWEGLLGQVKLRLGLQNRREFRVFDLKALADELEARAGVGDDARGVVRVVDRERPEVVGPAAQVGPVAMDRPHGLCDARAVDRLRVHLQERVP